MSQMQVLVVDDQYNELSTQLMQIDGITFRGLTKFNVEDVIGAIHWKPEPTVILLDILNPEGEESGIKVLEELGTQKAWTDKKCSVQIVVCSNEPTHKRHYLVAQAKRADVAGFINKNDLVVHKKPEAIEVLKAADRKARRYRDYPKLVEVARESSDLIYSPNSRCMDDVWETIVLAGRCWENVLIQGETGTGKELVAKAIFEVTKAAKIKGASRFIPYNIGSAPTEGNLQYVELFGATKGSANNILKYRKGIFECASIQKPYGATIFLDEIGDAAPIIQVSLLRVLQEEEVVPLGAFGDCEKVSVKVDNFRLIAASHRELGEEDRFRKDLYYRLNTITIRVPPLRERPDDIAVLAYHFIEDLNSDYAKRDEDKKAIAGHKERALIGTLQSYCWPGNVRQLEMAIRASYVTSPGTEFVLSEEIEEMLNEREWVGKSEKQPAEIWKELLSQGNPTSLRNLERKLGSEKMMSLVRYILQEYGGVPKSEVTKQVFKIDSGSFRKWVNSRKIKVRKVKNK